MCGQATAGNVEHGTHPKLSELRRSGRPREQEPRYEGFWLTALRTDGAAFLAAIGEPGQLGTPVPSCPDWTVGDLARHLGAVYRRTRAQCRFGRGGRALGAGRHPG